MKSKVKIIITAIIGLFIIIVGIGCYMIFAAFDSNSLLSYINKDTYDKDVKTVKNLYLLFDKYKGEISTNVISKSLNVFGTTVLQEYSKVNNAEEFFKKNKDSINKLTGITKVEEFKDLVTKAKTISKFEIIDYEFIEGTSEKGNKGTIIVVQFNYKNGEKVQFLAYIKNYMDEGKTPIEYTANFSIKQIIE